MKVIETTFPATPSGPNLPALLLQPNNPRALLVFGHGAGTPMRAPLMHQMAEALAHHHIATFRYDYPYSHSLETGYTQDLIDPLEVLLATTRAAIQAAQALASDLPLFLAGRSMSGQVMSLLLAREPLPHVRGLICYVYPNRWRALLPDTLAHLPHVPVPMLFIQGARDPEYCDLNELQRVIGDLAPGSVRGEPGRRPRRTVSNHTLHVIKDADHAFQLPPDASGTHHDAIRESATTTATWIHHQLRIPATSPPYPAS
ncbi:MAG: hypothetical protein OXR64_15235 [Chloroflexota bacterium]|nr:hypothetical protein [Chloroflexota bacterium]MDE2921189.1 hypothetical protein [Chloroflexota bacterium]